VSNGIINNAVTRTKMCAGEVASFLKIGFSRDSEVISRTETGKRWIWSVDTRVIIGRIDTERAERNPRAQTKIIRRKKNLEKRSNGPSAKTYLSGFLGGRGGLGDLLDWGFLRGGHCSVSFWAEMCQ